MRSSAGRRQELPVPPGPTGRRLRNLRGRVLEFPGFLERLHRDYGEIVSFQLPAMKCCAVFDADLIEEVLVVQEPSFRPFYPQQSYGVMKAPCLPRSHGEDHRRLSKVIAAGFEQERLAASADMIIENLLAAQERWRLKQRIEARHEMERLTMGVLLDAAVGRRMQAAPELLGDAIRALKRDLALSYLPLSSRLKRLPLPRNRNSRLAISALDDVVYEAIRKARGQSHRGDDFVSHFVWAADQEEFGQSLTSDDDIRDEAYSLMVASVEGPTSVLIHSIDRLARTPDVRERLEREADHVLGDRPIEAADFHRLPYARAVFQELLRVEPPAFAMAVPREAQEDCVLGGYLIPKGTMVQLCMSVLHRKQEYWQHPDDFMPERWLEGMPPDLPDNAYIPFGSGPRLCPGWEFATMMGVFALASNAQRLRLDPVSNKPLRIQPLGVGVKGPVPVTVTERGSVAR